MRKPKATPRAPSGLFDRPIPNPLRFMPPENPSEIIVDILAGFGKNRVTGRKPELLKYDRFQYSERERSRVHQLPRLESASLLRARSRSESCNLSMKRFTATEKWDKVWHRQLPCRLKCFWEYLYCKCNAIGVWEPDFDLASLQIGEKVSAADLRAFNGKVELLPDGKWFIQNFVAFQNGTLSKACPAHKPIYRLLEANPDISHRLGHRLLNSLQAAVKGIEEEKEKEGEAPPIESALNWLSDSRKNGSDYTESETHGAWLALNAGGWMWGKRPVTDWRSALERQIQSDRDRKHKFSPNGSNLIHQKTIMEKEADAILRECRREGMI